MRRGAELLPLERQLQAQITEQTKQRS
jgi:hypothetical protein